jgi:hypothetical protein
MPGSRAAPHRVTSLLVVGMGWHLDLHLLQPPNPPSVSLRPAPSMCTESARFCGRSPQATEVEGDDTGSSCPCGCLPLSSLVQCDIVLTHVQLSS